MNWEFHTFQTLDTNRLFDLLKLRTDVFVVEQKCAYPELDYFDNLATTIHLLVYDQHSLVAYARAMPFCAEAGQIDVTSVRIGRVVVTQSHRGTGLAERLMKGLINHLDEHYPGKDLILSAQQPILSFYEALGFNKESDMYLEDGIPHIDMRRTAQRLSNSD